jgi:hypothetical protein
MNKFAKFWMTVLVIGTITWLGSVSMRALIANEFFIPMTLTFNPETTLDQERTLFQLIEATSITIVISYTFVLISAIASLITVPVKFKDNGWLIMASVLFFLFVPAEIFTAVLDIKFVILWEATKDALINEGLLAYPKQSVILRETLSHRIAALGGVPVIALFCYYTAIITTIWRPLTRKKSAVTEQRTEA